MAVLGQGNKGPSAADRKTEVRIQLDNWRPTGTPDTQAKLEFEVICHSRTTGGACNASNDVRTDNKITDWMEIGNGNAWATLSSPEGALNGDKVANYAFEVKFTATISKPDGGGNDVLVERWTGGPFRCDSATYLGSARACVYDDEKPVVYRFDSRPAWKEQTDHVWKAQNKPDLTLPTSKYKKEIPGSPESKQPLTRRFNVSDNEANRDRSVRICKKFYGRNYATSAGYDRECDEYPFASTYEGSATGANGADNDTFKHFSVLPITAKHNGDAGIDLGKFYNDQRMLDGDEFYVHLVTPAGGDYAGPAVLAGVAAPIVYSQCASSTLVEAKQVRAGAYPEAIFNDYAKTTSNGWTGGDSTYTVTLPDGRRLWMFSDTFLGPLNSNGTRPTSAPLVNSSFVSQVGDSLTTITGGSASDREAIMPSSAESHWYWLGDGLVTTIGGERRLQVVFHEWHKFGSGQWDFGYKRGLVATFDPNDLQSPIAIDQIPASSGVQWGASVLSSEQSGDGYSYIYGVNDAPINKKMRIARVKGNNLAKTEDWQYFNSDRGWMYGETEGTDATTGVANEYSVTPHEGNFVLVSQDSTDAFSGKIRMWTGCDPYGPFGSWVGHDTVYMMPEGGPFGTCQDGNCFSYNAHVHPSLRTGNRWTLSYNVNNFDSRVDPAGAHYRDPTIYRPRFVSFELVSTSMTRAKALLDYSGYSGGPEKYCRPKSAPLVGTYSMPEGAPCP
ncbi:hypothetical protein [Streptomyces cyaneofuscatus]|uniref:NucA/NucB deoxyribonuclease domain-containing protein n=1 Tax=Streptomyces cyaneofuscatus TaxID=66883 RepID=UPI0036D76B57